MRIIDIQLSPDCRQYPIDSIEECISGMIILRSDPLSFHYSPKSFNDIQMWGI
jgi:hypothetical protein